MLEESYSYPYCSSIKERCLRLIEYGVWSGIDNNKLDAWLKNFNTDKERFFAACVLDQLIYRTEEQTISMLYDLLTVNLGNLFRSTGVSLEKTPLDQLRNKYKDPSFRIVSATKSEDAASKSGYLMCNLVVHHLSVPEKWVIRPEHIDRERESGIRIFVMLDDIICSGTQMSETIDDWKLMDKKDIAIYIAVCAAHENGIKLLNENYLGVNITFTEKLGQEDSIFNQLSLKDFDCDTKEDLKEYYKDFMRSKNVRYDNLLGFSEIELLYAFKHNVPNNCLPIIHYNDDNFNSLITKKK